VARAVVMKASSAAPQRKLSQESGGASFVSVAVRIDFFLEVENVNAMILFKWQRKR